MSTRIPPALKWLIDKRARLDAEIRRTEVSLAKAKSLMTELASLKSSLAAIDQTLALHEVKVDVSLIQPVRSKYVRINLPHGELTKSILMCLRLHAGERAVSTNEIVSFIAARYADLAATPARRSRLSQSVHDRIKPLVRSGVIQRHHDPKSNGYGLWSLAPDTEESR